MADDESQSEDQPTSIEQDKAVAWRNEQFRRAKMASRGLQSTDFGSGGGEFIEPVQSGQPVPQLYPEDRQLLAMATGTQIVSGTPELADSYNPPEIIPEYTADAITEVNKPSLATISAPPDLVEPGLPEPRSLWPPGSGKQATVEQLERQKTLDTSGPQPKAATERPNAKRPPMFVDRGPPEMPDIDFGSLGDIFGDSPSVTDTAHAEALKQASDSIGIAGEMLLAVINQMTAMLIRVSDGLSDVKDRLDSKDESDEW